MRFKFKAFDAKKQRRKDFYTIFAPLFLSIFESKYF